MGYLFPPVLPLEGRNRLNLRFSGFVGPKTQYKKCGGSEVDFSRAEGCLARRNALKLLIVITCEWGILRIDLLDSSFRGRSRDPGNGGCHP